MSDGAETAAARLIKIICCRQTAAKFSTDSLGLG